MERIYRSEFRPYEYILKANETKDDLPTIGIPAGSSAYRLSPWEAYFFDGEAWAVAKPSDEQVKSSVEAWLDAHPEATTTVEDGSISKAKLETTLKEILESMEAAAASQRVTSLTETALVSGTMIEAVGIPTYVSDVSQYSSYGITETGWYVFARVTSKDGARVTASTTVTGAAGYIATADKTYVDVAVRFDTVAQSVPVEINWGAYTDNFVFKASDLAVRNLDYRVTFYIYDIEPYITWTYTLTTDANFVANKQYYTKDGDTYTLATVTTGEAVPADTYYNHSKLHFEGMTPNVTYKLDTIVDCPIEIVLPEVADDGHGAWFEIQMRYDTTRSCTLLPPTGVKIGTATTQAQSGGINTIDLQYTIAGETKMWTLLNTHANIPT